MYNDVHGGSSKSELRAKSWDHFKFAVPIQHYCRVCTRVIDSFVNIIISRLTITMDLPHIGAHCALSTCNDLDLLPIRCNCEKLFCRHHIAPDKHACLAQLPHESKIPIEPWKKSERCAMQACNKLTLASANASPSDVATCSRCHKAFCARCVALSILRRSSLCFQPSLCRHTRVLCPRDNSTKEK